MATQTGSIYIFESMTGIVRIPTRNRGFSTMTNSVKVSATASDCYTTMDNKKLLDWRQKRQPHTLLYRARRDYRKRFAAGIQIGLLSATVPKISALPDIDFSGTSVSYLFEIYSEPVVVENCFNRQSYNITHMKKRANSNSQLMRQISPV